MAGRPRIHVDRAAKQAAYREKVQGLALGGAQVVRALREALATDPQRVVLYAEGLTAGDPTDRDLLMRLAGALDGFTEGRTGTAR